MASEQKITFYFDDPRLFMTAPGRMLVRFFRFAGFISLLVLMFVLFFSSTPRLCWLGVLLSLFLLHQALHFTKGVRPLDYITKGRRYNLADSLTPGAFAILESALDSAMFSGVDFRFVLLKKLCSLKDVQQVFMRMEIDYKEVLGEAERLFSDKVGYDKNAILGTIEEVVFGACNESQMTNEHYIESRALLAGFFEANDPKIKKILTIFSIDVSQIRAALIFGHVHQNFLQKLLRPRELGGAYVKRVRHRTMNRSWTARPTPLLDSHGNDLTDLAYAGAVGFLMGHKNEYDRLLDVLSRPGSPAALLVGETGIGKDSIIRHLAFNITKDKVPAILFDKRLVELRIESAIAGLPPHEAEKRMQGLIREIVTAGNIILYIPQIDMLAKTAESGLLNVADSLLPVLRDGSFPVIGATTPQAYKKNIEPRADFAAIFDVINVVEISGEEALTYLTYSAMSLEKQYGVIVTIGAVKEAVTLAHKYFRDRPLPGSAGDLLREAMAEAARLKEEAVTAAIIIKVAEKRVNVPIHEVSGGEADALIHLEERIHERYIDQVKAVASVSRALREYRSGLTRQGGPIASFLFVGPTGVGKTELSKILAELQFGSKEMMVRFDMSEFQEKGSLTRFIGSSDGAITGALTDAIRSKPYALVLLDEFEKADKDILNLFLQVLDEGRLTDGVGKVANFENSIIVATSNAHSEFIIEALEAGKKSEEIRDEVKRHLVDYFKPELINRFSDIIIFEPLGIEDMKKVTELQLKELAKDVLGTQEIVLTFTQEVIEAIARIGFTKTFGARPLRRAIEENLRGELANQILQGKISKSDAVLVSYEGEKFVFSKNQSN